MFFWLCEPLEGLSKGDTSASALLIAVPRGINLSICNEKKKTSLAGTLEFGI